MNRKQVEDKAWLLYGLFLTYNNPGDNPNFKLSKVNKDYFALSHNEVIFRCKKLSQVVKFLEKYDALDRN